MVRKIALACDHAGFEQLKELKVFLELSGFECVDFGPQTFDADDDYPDFIIPAAKAVAKGECDRGIIIGGSGQGEAMAANRVKQVRCALYYGPSIAIAPVDSDGRESGDPYEIIKLSRRHNGSNMLSLAARFLTMDQMKAAIELWLEVPPPDSGRHMRRIAKLDEV
jgi:ribose 5-phosphate isomerase B